MAVCPVCHGEGGFDERNLNAYLEEHLTEEQLALARQGRAFEPWLACEECEATGVVSDERAADLMAVARAGVQQFLAALDRGDFDAKLAQLDEL